MGQNAIVALLAVRAEVSRRVENDFEMIGY